MNGDDAFLETVGRAASTMWPFTFIRRIMSGGVALPYRPDVNFTGSGVTVTDTNGRTTVNVPVGPTAYQTIQDEGTPLTQRSTMNFVGANVTATDSGGITVVTISGTSVTSGTSLLDFGAFPGASDATLAVTGQTNILAASKPIAWILPATTADHSADEHRLETLDIYAGNVIAGTGFTIYGQNENGFDTRIYGKWNIGWMWT